MRIAWVLYGSLEQRTGGTIYDALVVEGLRRAGDEVYVVSIAASSDALALAARIREIDPEVVVGDELCFRELGIAFQTLAGGERPRRILLVHHLTAWETELSAERSREVHAAERVAIDASDALIVTSRTTKERLVSEGVSAKIDVVLPGADRLRGLGGRSERGPRVEIVFVGAVEARKRVLQLVRAFGRGTHRNGRLAIVGSTTHDAAYVGSVRAAIERLGLGERVVMDGEVDENGVAGALARADVFVMPSTLEGYGIAATEAIYAGVPVIAARAQGLEEALAPCPDATLFADDQDALASALERFASDPALRAAMTEAARAASPRMPTWSEGAERFRAALGVGLGRTR